MVIAPDREPIRVAIKQPKFNLDARKRLDMEDPETKKHFRSIQLEIKALTRPELHSHPNITTLLAWTYDTDDFRNSISLVQELAIANMELLLSTRGEEISASQKSSFCYDIAAALDAIHDCGFSHGDVKPSNVLIFPQRDGFVAKLADFGLSIVGMEGEEAKFNLGGTLGWQAPEAQESRLFGPDEIIKADNYSFGLVVWSTTLGSGRTPPSHSGKAREEWIIRELDSAKQSQDYSTFAALMPMTRVVLKADPAERPSRLLELIHASTLQDEFSHARTTNDDDFSGIVVPLTPLVPADFYWELPTFPDFFIKDLLPYGIENLRNLDPAMLFSLFLRLTQRGTGEREPESTRTLLEAAKQGFPPAQALVPLVLASYREPIPPEIHDQIDGWLASAICTGSFTDRKYLEASNPDAALAALQRFRDIGGYSVPYLNYSSLHALHVAAVHGTKGDILSILAMDSNLSIDDKTADGETPLYIACARGCWEIVAELLNRGADASVRCTRYGITCLHWLFAFEPALQSAVITGLIKAGADVNAIVTKPIPFYHFPFYLPGGSPLH
ncbi:kinase-like domain-containing protein [Xylaria curta]|nr:kinase-like domain-containing protein [Xylaria curta]